MRLAKFYATTALTMCLVTPPTMTLAQSSMVTDEDLSLLSPLAQMCMANPQGDDCGPVLDSISDCAADMTAAQCDILFDDPDAVFATPEDTERAQALLQQLDDEMAALDEPDISAPEMLDSLIEDAPEIVDDLIEDILPEDTPQDTPPEEPDQAEAEDLPADPQQDDAAETAAALQRALEEEEEAAQLAAELEAQTEGEAEADAAPEESAPPQADDTADLA